MSQSRGCFNSRWLHIAVFGDALGFRVSLWDGVWDGKQLELPETAREVPIPRRLEKCFEAFYVCGHAPNGQWKIL